MVFDAMLGLLPPVPWEVMALQPVALLQICGLEAATSVESANNPEASISSLQLCSALHGSARGMPDTAGPLR